MKGWGPRWWLAPLPFTPEFWVWFPVPAVLKKQKMFLPHPRVRVSIVESLRDREIACSASDRQGSNFESCVWRTVSSQSSHHPQEVLLAQFSLYEHKCGLKHGSFHFICRCNHSYWERNECLSGGEIQLLDTYFYLGGLVDSLIFYQAASMKPCRLIDTTWWTDQQLNFDPNDWDDRWLFLNMDQRILEPWWNHRLSMVHPDDGDGIAMVQLCSHSCWIVLPHKAKIIYLLTLRYIRITAVCNPYNTYQSKYNLLNPDNAAIFRINHGDWSFF